MVTTIWALADIVHRHAKMVALAMQSLLVGEYPGPWRHRRIAWRPRLLCRGHGVTLTNPALVACAAEDAATWSLQLCRRQRRRRHPHVLQKMTTVLDDGPARYLTSCVHKAKRIIMADAP